MTTQQQRKNYREPSQSQRRTQPKYAGRGVRSYHINFQELIWIIYMYKKITTQYIFFFCQIQQTQRNLLSHINFDNLKWNEQTFNKTLRTLIKRLTALIVSKIISVSEQARGLIRDNWSTMDTKRLSTERCWRCCRAADASPSCHDVLLLPLHKSIRCDTVESIARLVPSQNTTGDLPHVISTLFPKVAPNLHWEREQE